MGANAIEMYKGDDRTLLLTVTGVADIAGATIKMTAKKDPEVADAEAAFQLTTADAAEVLITGTASASIFIVPANTASLAARVYQYDIEMTLAGKVYTLLSDTLTLLEDVTKGA